MGLTELVGQGFLAVHMQTGIQGVDGDRGVPVLRGGDDHIIEVGSFQETAIVRVDPGAFSHLRKVVIKAQRPPLKDVTNG